jgi:Flp pilus assembly protein TadB
MAGKRFLQQLAAMLALVILSVGWSVPASAKSPRGTTQSQDVRKAQKKQAKAQKKYAKSQRKAERKMLKTERKNTHYPSSRF